MCQLTPGARTRDRRGTGEFEGAKGAGREGATLDPAKATAVGFDRRSIKR